MKSGVLLSFLILLYWQPSFSQKTTSTVDNLVFEGAGIRGIAYCGALEELEKRGVLSQVKNVAGTSSGAITACLLSVGYDHEEIFQIIGSTDFEKFNRKCAVEILLQHQIAAKSSVSSIFLV